MTVRVGTSGWSYAHWEPELYPHGLPGSRTAAAVRRRLPDRGAEQQLLPLAEPGPVQLLAAAAASRFPALGQGAQGTHPRPEAAGTRELDRAHRRRLARARRQAGGAAGPARAVARPRRRPAGLLPASATQLDPGRGRVPASQLALRGDLRAAGRARRRLLRHERRATCPASCARPRTSSTSGCTAPTSTTCTRAPTATPTSAGGRTGYGNGAGRAGRLRLLQQRR